MTTWILLALVAAVGLPYVAWTRFEARGQRRAARAHEEVVALGDDVVPVSIHPEVDLDACIGSGACVRACPEDQVLAITDGRARLVNPMTCIGHSACLSACPVGAIKLVFGTATRGIELPKLSASFETSRAGIYVVGELGGMGLIRNAVEQGRQAATAIVKSGRRGAAGDLDAIVVGSGPAGIAAALALGANGLNYLVVEQNKFGGTIAHYPRAKVVMTGAIELPGYGTVRRSTMTKEKLIELWTDIRERTRLPLKEGVRITSITAEGNAWRLRGDGFQDRAANVILALGRRGAPKELGVPGEELAKVVYRVIEPDVFAQRRVLVVGGGNAAADCAIALAEQGGCRAVGLSYRRSALSRVRASVAARVDELIRQAKILPYFGTEVVSIAAEHVMLRSARGLEQIDNDHVVVQIGGTAPSELLHSIGIELVEKRGEA